LKIHAYKYRGYSILKQQLLFRLLP